MKVTFVVGPTASGKSSLALEWAEARRGVIVNCDSVQVYDLVQIGAAKPSKIEMERVPHYLYGHVQPPSAYTAGDYQRDFFSLLPQLEGQGVGDVFVVGGTGFYFQAIEKGMFSVEKSSREFKESLEQEASTPEGLLKLFEEMRTFDPAIAEKIHPNDRYRILRAVEVIRIDGKKPSELRQEKSQASRSFPYPLEKIGIAWERSELHQRIHHRVKQMLSQGLIEEVENLNKLGLQDWAPLKSVGYKEVQEYLRGEIRSLEDLEEQILISTRQLAKRQITWFRRDQEVQWRLQAARDGTF